jgi:indolepyruvate ferredoxin oxidoreductase beta subunit
VTGRSLRHRIYLAGVGGMGAMTASRLLADAALRAGENVVVGEVHGMAQRGGVVHSAILVGPGRGCLIDDGEADVLLALEPIEALRALSRASSEALVVANTHPVVPYTAARGDAPYPDVDEVMRCVAGAVKTLVAFDAHEIAVRAGSPRAANIALLGALAASGALPFNPAHLEAAVAARAAWREVNLRAYAAGQSAFAARAGSRAPAADTRQGEPQGLPSLG